jgi:hypothetical protein
VSSPEHAPQRALHNQSAGGAPYAQASHVHARGSVPEPADDAMSLTERNRRRLEERWGKPIEEPADDAPLEPGDGFDWRTILRGLTIHVHLVRDPLPSMRAVRADYKAGKEDAQQQSGTATFFFVVFGIVGQGLGLGFRFLATCCDRPGRFAGLLFITALLAGSLAWAGLI